MSTAEGVVESKAGRSVEGAVGEGGVEASMTAEAFAARTEGGRNEELVSGRIVTMPATKPRHGEICCEVAYVLRRFLEDHDLGRVVANDAGVVTGRNPDTVRGADLAYYSFARVPKGPLPDRYLDVVPDLVIEVLSPSDRWHEALSKAAEYLAAGVTCVVVLDDGAKAAHVFDEGRKSRVHGAEETLSLSEVLPGFAVRVGRLFP